ncbi:MAG: sulfite exporter TauE/SafE family protein [Hydrogenoanaerobacterium sp.]
MNIFFMLLASAAAGLAAALGVGGGAVLLLYLTAFAEVNQLTAQGINLLFFVPIAIVSVCFHAKNKLINYRSAVIFILFGLLGVWGGLFFAKLLDEIILSKLFASFLFIMGLKELFAKPTK